MKRRDPLAGATRRMVDANGIRMAIVEQGHGPAVVLCHGFPELGYSWRHQIPALAEAGFHVIAPDQRGYGDTDRPEATADYDIHHLAGDLVGLLDALGLEKAVFAGHDWGGLIVWEMPRLHPTRTAGVIGVNTPALPRPPFPPVSMLRAMFGDSHYIVHFQEPGVADEALARDVPRVFTQLMRGAAPLEELIPFAFKSDGKIRSMVEIVEADGWPGEPLLDEEELRFYVAAFERTGFTGGINWYRNIDRNWETTAHLPLEISVPALMVTAELDPALRPELAEPMRGFVSDLEIAMIPGCGHWTQQEKPDELNRLMVDWLSRRFLP
jgi:microsomal epoxide hydrolase